MSMSTFAKPSEVHLQMDHLWNTDEFKQYRQKVHDERQAYIATIDTLIGTFQATVRKTAVSPHDQNKVYVGEGGHAILSGICTMLETYKEYVTENAGVASDTLHYQYVFTVMDKQDERDRQIMWLCCTLLVKLDYFNRAHHDVFFDTFGVTYKECYNLYYRSHNYVGVFDIVARAQRIGKSIPKSIASVMEMWEGLA